MGKSIIADKSEDFAVKIVELSKRLKDEGCEYALRNQILRSGTSIGANTAEGASAYSKPDFYAKMGIALKEADETLYWLRLLHRSGYIKNDYYNSLYEECKKLTLILTAILKNNKN